MNDKYTSDFMYHQYFHLHGIYHSNFNSNPQDIIPYLQEGQILQLKPQTNNIYDKYAVAVFYSNNYIGWIPKEENQPLHQALINNVNYNCYVYKTYEVSYGYGCEICVKYSNNYAYFNPYSVNTSNVIPVLSYNEKNFLEYLHGRSVLNPNIGVDWINYYNIDYPTVATKFLKASLLRFSNDIETISCLKTTEIKDVLKKFKLPVTGNKSELIIRIIDNIDKNALHNIAYNLDRKYIITPKAIQMFNVQIKDKQPLKRKYVITDESESLSSQLKKVVKSEKIIKNLKCDELKSILRKHNLPVSGNKHELSRRIIENLSYSKINNKPRLSNNFNSSYNQKQTNNSSFTDNKVNFQNKEYSNNNEIGQNKSYIDSLLDKLILSCDSPYSWLWLIGCIAIFIVLGLLIIY